MTALTGTGLECRSDKPDHLTPKELNRDGRTTNGVERKRSASAVATSQIDRAAGSGRPLSLRERVVTSAPPSTVEPELTRLGYDIGLVVDDLPSMDRFYAEGLGLPKVLEMVMPEGNRYAGRTMHTYAAGHSMIKLWKLPGAPPSPTTSERYGAFGMRYLTLFIRDIEAVLARLRLMGYEVVGPSRSVLNHPVTLALVKDPEGNSWELVEKDIPSAPGANRGEAKRSAIA